MLILFDRSSDTVLDPAPAVVGVIDFNKPQSDKRYHT